MMRPLHPRYSDCFGDGPRPECHARNAAATTEVVSAIARGAHETFIADLRSEYGWSDLDAALAVDLDTRRIRCRLTTRVERTAWRFCRICKARYRPAGLPC